MKSMYLDLILKGNVRFNGPDGYVQVNKDNTKTWAFNYGHMALYYCWFKPNENDLLAQFLEQSTPEIKLL